LKTQSRTGLLKLTFAHEGWSIGRNLDSRYKLYTPILSPEMKVEAFLLTTGNKGKDSEKVFNSIYKYRQNNYDDYDLREETKLTKKHGDYTVMSYTADYKKSGESYIEHRFNYIKDTIKHCLLFKCKKELYPEMKADIETITSQFHVE